MIIVMYGNCYSDIGGSSDDDNCDNDDRNML
jgi:hypothetical protein